MDIDTEQEKIDEEKANTISYCLEVKGIIEDTLRKMGVFFDEIEVFKGLSSSGPKFIIKSAESSLLIGHHGDNLRALNHLVRKIVYKKSGLAKFTVDINNYREEVVKRVRNQAISSAQKVKETKSPIEMEPMPAYERMVIHSLFSQDPEISTESIGEKDQRRVVIKLKT